MYLCSPKKYVNSMRKWFEFWNFWEKQKLGKKMGILKLLKHNDLRMFFPISQFPKKFEVIPIFRKILSGTYTTYSLYIIYFNCGVTAFLFSYFEFDFNFLGNLGNREIKCNQPKIKALRFPKIFPILRFSQNLAQLAWRK